MQVGPIKANIGASKDFGSGIKNGRTYSFSNTIVKLVTIEVLDEEYGLGIEAKHIEHTNVNDIMHNNPVSMPWEVWDCRETSRTVILGKTKKRLTIKKSNEGTFIGISGDLHIGIGGSFKIGFELAW